MKVHSQWKQIQQGAFIKLWLADNGCIGYTPGNFYAYSHDMDVDKIVGCQYPEYSEQEHLYRGGLWIGAVIDTAKAGQPPMFAKFVTVSDNYNDWEVIDQWGETTTVDSSKPFYLTSIFNSMEPNKTGHDDDIDGSTDEDELDGYDNDGDGKIDEDYGAISEGDLYITYTDTANLKNLPYHKPLGILVHQRSYTWGQFLTKPIFIIDYNIVNLGIREIKEVYIGIWMEPTLGYLDHIGRAPRQYNLAGYWPELMTVHVNNATSEPYTPIGFTILCLPRPLNKGNLIFRWSNNTFNMWELYPKLDETLYDYMSGVMPTNAPQIQDDQPGDNPKYVNVLLSFGPINDWAIGETLKFTYAIVSGMLLKSGSDNLYDNAKAAQTLYARGYKPPVILPAPKIRFETGFRKIELRWGYTGTGINPMEVWDDANQLVQFYPQDHWRRINPPEGHTTGGRVFAGYRLYRSEDPAGTRSSFTMLRQWDMKDTVGPSWGYQTGIETTFVDDNLVTGKTYWYSVTSFGLPDFHVMDYIDRDSTIKRETLATKSGETSVLASRKRMKLPFSVSHEKDQVAVVPNPYKVTENYTFESGGYEGRQRSWTEDKRVLKFIHLPPKCTIRIYTMTGEIVSTIYHEDPTQGEHSWNLKSDSNRSIASGVYVFTVESDYGKQIGKFVVIR